MVIGKINFLGRMFLLALYGASIYFSITTTFIDVNLVASVFVGLCLPFLSVLALFMVDCLLNLCIWFLNGKGIIIKGEIFFPFMSLIAFIAYLLFVQERKNEDKEPVPEGS